MKRNIFDHKRIKQPHKHKNSAKATGYKDKEYLAYMHNSDKVCVMCGNTDIELHHLKFNSIVGRDDKYVVPLCKHHHRSDSTNSSEPFSIHGTPSAFYDILSKKELMQKALVFYLEYQNDKVSKSII